MKNYLKKAAVLTLAGVMTVGSMTGCSSNVDGTKTASTVNDEAIKLGTVNFMLRYQQAQTAQMYEMYFGGAAGIWDTVADEESGETYGEQTVTSVREQIEDMVILRQHAPDYDVTITDEEKEKITAAAQSFMEANDEATLTKLGVDQSAIEEVLELSTYNEKMFDPMVADVDTKVSDDEAAQTGVTYVSVAPAEEETADAEEGAEDSEAKEPTEKADPKEQAQQILDEVLATADADMDAIAKSVDENLSATTTHFTTNPPEDEEEDSTSSVPQEIQDAVKNLKDGEVASELIDIDGTYYVVRLDVAFDEDATNDQKDTIVNQRKQDKYTEITDGWREESTITVDDKVMKVLKLTDNDKYTFKQVEQETTDEESSDDSTTLEGADAEAGSVDEVVDAVDDLAGDSNTDTAE